MGKIYDLFEQFNFFYHIKKKQKNHNPHKKQVILLGDGFFARGFLHTIDYNKYNITQIYRDPFINPQDILYNLQNNNQKSYTENNIHFRDLITKFRAKNSLTKIKEEIKTLDINKSNVQINGNLYNFDYLVIGLGAQKSLKTWANEIETMKTNQVNHINEETMKVNHINGEKNNKIAMIGIGPVGLELTMILSKYNKIDVYDGLSKDKILLYVRPQTKQFLLDILKKNNVRLHLEQFYDKEKNSHDKIILCVGCRPNVLTSNLKVMNNFQLESNSNVYIGGDCANTTYIKTAQMAYQQGIYIAKQLNGEIDKNTKFEFRSNGITLNLPDKKVIVEGHPFLPDCIYPNWIVKLYSLFFI